ncbi:MAG: TonB-dependent receptor plug domain-containing protein, partial [Parabacteroides sp.]|nr:TonB-dependent receptor plug domain-containing protein [Parabacteroides sp.]
MKKVNLLMACLASSIGVASAQTQKVTGQVISAEDGMPVIGAAIIVKGTSIGTVSDLDGKFSLEVPADAKTIFISYVGLKTKEMPVASFLNVKLESDSQALDEVVVTAMGISREKKSLGYAIQEVGAEELTKAGQISVTGALSGKVAGVQVNQFGGSVGASSRISVRGNSSLSADQQPLIVVDGVPISNAAKRSGDNTYNGVDYGSGLNDINPEDIESMTVLKGGSAALYGMRAGNGVILITTKSGKKSGGVKVMYDGNFTVDKISTMPKLQNSYGQGNIGDEYHWKLTAPNMSYQEYAEQYGFNWVDGSNGINDFYDESWGPRLDAGLNLVQYDSNGQKAPWISRPNNVKDFFQTGYSMNHTISLAANSDKASTRASLSFRDQKGTVPNTDQKRYSAQLNSSIKLNKYISYDLSTSYTRTKSDNLPAQGYGGNNPINSLVAWSGRQINMQTLKDNWDQKDANGNYTMYNWNN